MNGNVNYQLKLLQSTEMHIHIWLTIMRFKNACLCEREDKLIKK